MTRGEQIERVASVLAGNDGRPHPKLAERIVDALAQPVELHEAARELLDVLNAETCNEAEAEAPWGRERRSLRAALEAGT